MYWKIKINIIRCRWVSCILRVPVFDERTSNYTGRPEVEYVLHASFIYDKLVDWGILTSLYCSGSGRPGQRGQLNPQESWGQKLYMASASEMTYIVPGGALNSTHSLTAYGAYVGQVLWPSFEGLGWKSTYHVAWFLTLTPCWKMVPARLLTCSRFGRISRIS